MPAELFPAGVMPPAEDILRILPEIILAGTATILMVLVPLIKRPVLARSFSHSMMTLL